MFITYHRSGRISLVAALAAIPVALMVVGVATLALVTVGLAVCGIALARIFGRLRPVRRAGFTDDVIEGVVVTHPIGSIGPPPADDSYGVRR